MKPHYHWYISLMLLIAGVFGGCEAPIPATPPATVPSDSGEDTWAAWLAMADGDQAEWDVAEATRLTEVLVQQPGGLDSMLALVAEETRPASVNVLVIMCLTPYRELLAPYESAMVSLTAVSHSAPTRAVGAHLLGLLPTPSATDHVVALLDDEDRSVREAAMGVLVSFHGLRIGDRLEDFWDDPETSHPIREQLILGMAPELVVDHLDIFADAVVDPGLNPAARYKAATVLGQLGGSEHRAALARCAESDTDSHVKERAQGGLALLDARVVAKDPAAHVPGE